MNVAAAYLSRESVRLGLRHLGPPERLDWLALTPRFRASAHVVFLAFANGNADPVLVAKVARLPGWSMGLQREAAMLRVVQESRPGGFDSVPRLVAQELVGNVHLLVETGVPGRPLDARMVQRRPQEAAAALVDWTAELGAATTSMIANGGDVHARLIDAPLSTLERQLPDARETDTLLSRTRELVAPLHGGEFPLVVQHGDLGAPNVLLRRGGGVGVVDWELAEAGSLPAQDLFFALAYLAFARSGARDTDGYVRAFHEAFFVEEGWVRQYVSQYAFALGLPTALLKPLFVACWFRYVAARASRLLDDDDAARLDDETAAWLTRDRYFALWQHAVRHVDALRLTR